MEEGVLMPLVKGNSRAAIGKNIKTEEDEGKSHAQALAIALHTAKSKKKDDEK